MNNKRGSAMVEAAMVLPIVILAVVSVIYIMIAMYSDVAGKCAIDYGALCAGGAISEVYSVDPDKSGADEFEKSSGLLSRVSGSRSYSSALGGLLGRGRYRGAAEGRCYCFSEEEYIRNMDLMGSFTGR